MSQVYYNHTTKLNVVKDGYVPAATIALRKEGNNFVYGVSICSKYDNFSKKYGREIALNRLERNFKVTEIPADLMKAAEAEGMGEKGICLPFLYQLAASVTTKNRKWKKKITKFNLEQKTPVVDINISTNTTNPSRNWNTDERA